MKSTPHHLSSCFLAALFPGLLAATTPSHPVSIDDPAGAWSLQVRTHPGVAFCPVDFETGAQTCQVSPGGGHLVMQCADSPTVTVDDDNAAEIVRLMEAIVWEDEHTGALSFDEALQEIQFKSGDQMFVIAGMPYQSSADLDMLVGTVFMARTSVLGDREFAACPGYVEPDYTGPEYWARRLNPELRMLVEDPETAARLGVVADENGMIGVIMKVRMPAQTEPPRSITQELEALGVTVQTKAGEIWTASVPVIQIRTIAEQDFIVKMEGGRRLYLEDEASDIVDSPR